MSALYIVLPLAILVVVVAVGAFLWAARRGQFDDLETPAMRMLHDDAEARPVAPKGGGPEADEDDLAAGNPPAP